MAEKLRLVGINLYVRGILTPASRDKAARYGRNPRSKMTSTKMTSGGRECGLGWGASQISSPYRQSYCISVR
jgi:hypothetical protein